MSKKETTATVKITFDKFLKIVNETNTIARNAPNLLKTKFGYALRRFIEINQDTVFSDYNLALSTIRIDNALIDETTKALLTKDDDRGFQYGKDGLKKLITEEKKLENEWKDKEFDVKPFISAHVPDLDDDQKELFGGYVI